MLADWCSFGFQMTKVILQYILSFLILLSGSYSQAYSHSDQGLAHFDHTRNGRTLNIKHLLTAAERQNDRINPVDDEAEEDDSVSFKKDLEIKNHFLSAFHTQKPLFFSQSIKTRLAHHKHSTNPSIHRYLIYRALLIWFKIKPGYWNRLIFSKEYLIFLTCFL